MIVWMKAAHIIALSVWCAGLIALPMILAQRRALSGPALYRIQLPARFIFVTLVSPLAFIAIGTGTVLVFAQETFTGWFAAKLFLVGVMAKIHIRIGTAIVEVFKEDGRYTRTEMIGTTATACVVIAAVIAVVSLKPAIDVDWFPAGFFAPGHLSEAVGLDHPFSSTMMPMP